ncbi:hypothetical protein [Amycolatopsis plumensis]|uniref:Uncharacterized protein n=1 Tax=Amycolatopsis plumensis TaxID=236508 RepID=A0ABV5U8G3_9PSEU
MAEDAAGAVRRTPGPEAVDQLAGLIEVGLHPPAAKCPFCENARRAAARILAAGWQLRPVVLLLAEACDCTPPYADCPHGPEPVDALDLAVWLHAEAEWQREQARNLFIDHYNATDGQMTRIGELETLLRERTGERDARQARIDAAKRWLDDPQDLTPAGQLYQIRAALQGDQPAGPPDFAEVRGELADGRRFTGRVDLRPARELADRLAAEAAAQSTGEVDRG